jgi:hypothetical protein
MNFITLRLIAFYDALYEYTEKQETRRLVATMLVLYFLSALLLIEANRFGLLPLGLAPHVALNRFVAVNQAFTLVLVLEVVDLVFCLPKSTSKSVGKQFEILALILLRGAFKGLSQFPEPINVDQHQDVLLNLGLNAMGALMVFVLLGVYSWLNKRGPKLKKPRDLVRFIAAKKLVALTMLASFIFMGVQSGVLMLQGMETIDVFHDFFTLLIFTDVLLLLIAQRHLPEFHTIFRNSGFALATMLIRLALTANTHLSIAVSVAAVSFAVGVTACFNAFYCKVADNIEPAETSSTGPLAGSLGTLTVVCSDDSLGKDQSCTVSDAMKTEPPHV